MMSKYFDLIRRKIVVWVNVSATAFLVHFAVLNSFLRIVWRSAWSFNIHCISIFWWSCFSCHMLKYTLFSHQWFNNFFSFIACFWQSLYTSSFILLWSFYVISFRKWKSQWSSSMHSADAWCTHLCINISSYDLTMILTFVLSKYWLTSLHSLSFNCNAIFMLTFCRLWNL